MPCNVWRTWMNETINNTTVTNVESTHSRMISDVLTFHKTRVHHCGNVASHEVRSNFSYCLDHHIFCMFFRKQWQTQDVITKNCIYTTAGLLNRIGKITREFDCTLTVIYDNKLTLKPWRNIQQCDKISNNDTGKCSFSDNEAARALCSI